mmetsp:Transcript_53092/g.124095  ORF Transcript_53092/g.124095 Transcript_53092/m.124095 type:complete len:243 (+) Transcript_53092:450-1178(+)
MARTGGGHRGAEPSCVGGHRLGRIPTRTATTGATAAPQHCLANRRRHRPTSPANVYCNRADGARLLVRRHPQEQDTVVHVSTVGYHARHVQGPELPAPLQGVPPRHQVSQHPRRQQVHSQTDRLWAEQEEGRDKHHDHGQHQVWDHAVDGAGDHDRTAVQPDGHRRVGDGPRALRGHRPGAPLLRLPERLSAPHPGRTTGPKARGPSNGRATSRLVRLDEVDVGGGRPPTHSEHGRPRTCRN